jgi:hypothetical protein
LISNRNEGLLRCAAAAAASNRDWWLQLKSNRNEGPLRCRRCCFKSKWGAPIEVKYE